MADREENADLPMSGTVERWAHDVITATSLSQKSAIPPAEARWQSEVGFHVPAWPGRPSELRVTSKTKMRGGLSTPVGRARVLHSFWHHELQAAELMAWALLSFPKAPQAFRRGLLRIALDEIRHMARYEQQITRLGSAIGQFEVRDWFWERVPSSKTPAAFVAVMGLGLESANLEHTRSFAQRFRQEGDEESAHTQEVVGREELSHVRFGVRWFRAFTGGLEFDPWRNALPHPLTPLLMRGKPIHRQARLAARQPAHFIDDLERWQPV